MTVETILGGDDKRSALDISNFEKLSIHDAGLDTSSFTEVQQALWNAYSHLVYTYTGKWLNDQKRSERFHLSMVDREEMIAVALSAFVEAVLTYATGDNLITIRKRVDMKERKRVLTWGGSVTNYVEMAPVFETSKIQAASFPTWYFEKVRGAFTVLQRATAQASGGRGFIVKSLDAWLQDHAGEEFDLGDFQAQIAPSAEQEVIEQAERAILADSLPTDRMRTIAWLLEIGLSEKEIAEKVLACSVKTVQRDVRDIRIHLQSIGKGPKQGVS